MKIVDRTAFLALPAGTLYSKYDPFGSLEELQIKGDTWLPNDFLHQGISDAIACSSSSDYGTRFERMEHLGESMPMDFDCLGRDGCFDADQLFVVWERADVEGLLSRLQRALVDGYKE